MHHRAPHRTSTALRLLAAAVVAAAGLSAAGCSETLTKHGHHFRENDVQQINTGMSQEQVKLTMGTPSTTSTVGGGAYYYISSTEAQASFLTPRLTDRQVVAVYFDQGGLVERVANYGIKDGKVFDFISRTTPASGARDEGILRSLFRNLGSRQIFGQ